MELVVAQLREDVERGVVHRDVLQVALVVVGAQGAAGVERVAEGVDVEVAREAARHHVGLAGERTGGVLLAQRSHDLNRRADFAADVEIVAEIDRVAVHLVRDAPAVVAQEADRGVGARLLGAGRDAERVLVHEVVGEQLVEPVGVGPGVLHQEVVARLPRVLQPEFAAAGVVGVDLVVHDAVNARVRGVHDVGSEQPLALHFGEDRHLVVGIHDVVLRITGLGPQREVAVVGDDRGSLFSPLGGDDDHAVHGAGAVERRCGGVLQDVEGLDVRSVDARHRGAEQRGGVAARKLVVGDVHDVLEHHAVHYPQRLVVAVDRRDAADADFGGRAERSRDVLHRDARHLAFEHAAHVRHAGHVQVLGLEFDGRSGEGLLLDVLESGHDDRVHFEGGFLKGDVDVPAPLDLHLLRVVAHVADHQRRRACGQGECEFALCVGRYADGRALDGHAHEIQRFAVLGIPDYAGESCLGDGCCEARTKKQKQE